MYRKQDSSGMRVYRHKCSGIATAIREALQSALSKNSTLQTTIYHCVTGSMEPYLFYMETVQVKKIMSTIKANSYHILP